MRPRYEVRRVIDAAKGFRAARELDVRSRWPRERLRQYQQQRLEALVEHARRHSPYYRERLPGGPVALERLPVLDKALMMERFDELVTDRRLRREELLAWVERLERDDLYLGRYRAMTTSGSSGLKGLFVYDRPEWVSLLAVYFVMGEIVGMRPRLPRRRMAQIQGASANHMSRQLSASVSLGVHRVLGLPVTLPVEQLVEELNRFKPEVMNVYPSVAMRLADEALAGRLRVPLNALTTSSEMRTPEMTERLEEAFAAHPFNVYATTEGLWGIECERHDGIHLFEDSVLVENVDAGGRPVPAGEPGAKLLVTNLMTFAQPIIRLELADVLVLDDEPCACGRTLVRARSIEGRSDDVICLHGSGGREVRVEPLQFGVISRQRDVREFQVVQSGDVIRIQVVPREAAAAGLEERIADAVRGRLAELGVERPRVEVVRRDALPRSAGGKLQLVLADARASAGTARAPS